MVGTYQALIEAAGLLCMMLIGNVSVIITDRYITNHSSAAIIFITGKTH